MAESGGNGGADNDRVLGGSGCSTALIVVAALAIGLVLAFALLLGLRGLS